MLHRFHPSALPNGWQNATLRYKAARRSRKQIVLVLLLVLDCPISDYENEDDEEDERFARPATIWTDTDRLQVCATVAASALNKYDACRYSRSGICCMLLLILLLNTGGQ